MRLVDADAVYSDIKERYIEVMNKKGFCGEAVASAYALAVLADAPTVDAAPVVRGKWIVTRLADNDGPACYKCSECSARRNILVSSNYCPNCGARMCE